MEYDGYEYTELTGEEMIFALKQRIKEYEARYFSVLLDSKAEALSNNPQKLHAIRQINMQMEDLKGALEMCRIELANLTDPELVADDEAAHGEI